MLKPSVFQTWRAPSHQPMQLSSGHRLAIVCAIMNLVHAGSNISSKMRRGKGKSGAGVATDSGRGSHSNTRRGSGVGGGGSTSAKGRNVTVAPNIGKPDLLRACCPELYEPITCRSRFNRSVKKCQSIELLGVLYETAGPYFIAWGLRYATERMMRMINHRQEILPGYEIFIDWHDDAYEAALTARVVTTQLTQHPRRYAAVFHGSDSGAQLASIIAHSHQRPHIGVHIAASLSNHNRMPSYWRTVSPFTDLAPGYLELCRRFGWRKLGLTFSSRNFYLEGKIFQSNLSRGVQVTFSQSVTSPHFGFHETVDKVRTFRTRVLLVMASEDVLTPLVCDLIMARIAGIILLTGPVQFYLIPQEKYRPGTHSLTFGRGAPCSYDAMASWASGSVLAAPTMVDMRGFLLKNGQPPPIGENHSLTCLPSDGSNAGGDFVAWWFREFVPLTAPYPSLPIMNGADAICLLALLFRHMIFERGHSADDLSGGSQRILEEERSWLSTGEVRHGLAGHLKFPGPRASSPGDPAPAFDIIQIGPGSGQGSATPSGLFGNHVRGQWPGNGFERCQFSEPWGARCDNCSHDSWGRCKPGFVREGRMVSLLSGAPSWISQCEPCAPGKHASTQNETCAACGPGKFSGAAAQLACLVCAIGKFTDAHGASVCQDCVSGKYRGLGDPPVSCIRCSEGTYQQANASAGCRICPQGAMCPLNRHGLRISASPRPNWFRFDHGPFRSTFAMCPTFGACMGGENVCAEGMTGSLCNVCASGWTRSSTKSRCGPCPHIILNICLICFAIVLYGAYISLMVKVFKSSGTQQADVKSIIMKLCINYLQLSGVAFRSASFIPNDGVLHRVLEFTGGLTGDPSRAVLSLDCLSDTLHKKYEMKMVMLALILIPVAWGCAASMYLLRHKLQHGDLALDPSEVLRRLAPTIVVICFMLHPVVTDVFLKAIDCNKLDTWRLRSNTEIVCGSMDYSDGVITAVAGILIWSLGIPIVFFALLFRHRRRLFVPSTRRWLGFLCNGFEPRYYYFECVFMLRKVVVLIASAVPVKSVPLNWVLLVIVGVICLSMHQQTKPFNNLQFELLDRIESRNLWAFVFTMLACVLLEFAGRDGKLRVAVLLSVTAIHANYIVFVFFAFVRRPLARRINYLVDSKQLRPVVDKQSLGGHLRPSRCKVLKRRLRVGDLCVSEDGAIDLRALSKHELEMLETILFDMVKCILDTTPFFRVRQIEMILQCAIGVVLEHHAHESASELSRKSSGNESSHSVRQSKKTMKRLEKALGEMHGWIRHSIADQLQRLRSGSLDSRPVRLLSDAVEDAKVTSTEHRTVANPITVENLQDALIGICEDISGGYLVLDSCDDHVAFSPRDSRMLARAASNLTFVSKSAKSVGSLSDVDLAVPGEHSQQVEFPGVGNSLEVVPTYFGDSVLFKNLPRQQIDALNASAHDQLTCVTTFEAAADESSPLCRRTCL